jgi:hypothetical protein
MARTVARVPLFVAALSGVLALPASSRAQAIWGSDLESGFRPGASARFDGDPFSHRYNYYAGPVFYPGMDAQRLWNLYYLDRLDRAERFGYRPPPPPPVVVPSRPLFHRFRRTPHVEWVEPVPVVRE